MNRSLSSSVALLSCLAFSAAQAQQPATRHAGKPSAEAFLESANEKIKNLAVQYGRTSFVNQTYITDDTEALAADLEEKTMALTSQLINESLAYKNKKLSAEAQRQLYLLQTSLTLPSPNHPKLRAELAELIAKLGSMYGKGEYCPAEPLKLPSQPTDTSQNKSKGERKPTCYKLDELSRILATSRDPALMKAAWAGWHETARPMKPLYARLTELANIGARDMGYQDTGEYWRVKYDMSGEAFAQETDRLWSQVKPLYEQLHCYVRGRLNQKYGNQIVPKEGAIPAHLLGNMWAQEWQNIYPLVEPYPQAAPADVTQSLVTQNYTPVRMVKTGESFFTGLGFDPLPATFWSRSLFSRPRDREVVCHASAWDVTMSDDLRIKMCIEINEENLSVIHHELGHNYYYHEYRSLPALYQAGANDGFHEAIGDTLVLSMTPTYLKKLGLIERVGTSEQAIINQQLKSALGKVAFLPFGLLIDRWRWDVFSGKVKPENYNSHWWALRQSYQGVAPSEKRGEAEFDPGAKYHIPANTPYMRYFLAHILQYQFHRGLCKAAGHKGPLHECSIAGNAAAGSQLKAMLKMGASKPWQEALKAITGETKMDASAVLDYYAPLYEWLKTQNSSPNSNQKCGW